jgi:hypothetical protein
VHFGFVGSSRLASVLRSETYRRCKGGFRPMRPWRRVTDGDVRAVSGNPAVRSLPPSHIILIFATVLIRESVRGDRAKPSG